MLGRKNAISVYNSLVYIIYVCKNTHNQIFLKNKNLITYFIPHTCKEILVASINIYFY